MLLSLVLTLAQLGLKLLIQFKILKDEATIKELQRRFEAALRNAEKDSLDSTRLKEQHDANMDDLRDKHDKVWGSPVSAPSTTPTSDFAIKIDPPQPKAKEAFVITFAGMQDVVPEVWVDQQYSFGTAEWTGAAYKKSLLLNTAGERTIDLKVKGQWATTAKLTIRTE